MRMLLPALACCLTSLAAQQGLAARLGEVTQRAEFKHATWGLLLVDLANGEVAHEENADKLFAPASTTKLFSVAAALTALGAEHRFVTRVVRRGEVDRDGTLRGDLLLLAAGDPTFGGRTDAEGRIAYTSSDHIYSNGNERGKLTEPDPLAGLDALALQVAKSGIRAVQGEIAVDDRMFEPESSTGSGPRRVVPLIVNDNLIDLLITPRLENEPAQVDWRPRSSLVQVDAQVTTGPKGSPTEIRVETAAYGRIVVRGRLAQGHAPLVRTQEVERPIDFGRGLWIEALRRAGVTVLASPFHANSRQALPPPAETHALPEVGKLESPPFAEECKLVLKVSHNLHASLLPILLATKAGKRTLTEGLQEQRKVLAELGVPVDTISFGGGAGGSPADRTTPRATVALLRAIARQSTAAAFRAGLPVLGVDGTLANAVGPQSPARGKAQAKTGTYYYDNPMNGTSLLTSKALAGYLTGKSGREFAFCFVVNGVHLAHEGEADRIGQALGTLCEIAFAGL